MKQFLICICVLLPGTVLGKDYFTAAVFEHRPRALNTSQESAPKIISSNLRIYEEAIPLAARKGADIIVFNEYGLFMHVRDRNRMKQFMEHVPDPETRKVNPCTEKMYSSFILSSLSCMAREYNIYIVANFGDIQPCLDTCDADEIDECKSKCPDDGVRIYNTNVAFDREGNIVARYHKVHPYFEYVNSPTEDEFITFKTDFGTFGLIVCFDAVFEEATLLAKNHGIDTLLFTTFWYDDIVPFNAVEFQQAWALEHGVNFIAANAHRPGTASLGSGIYSKDTGALVYSYEPDGESKLLITNVKIRGDSEIPQLRSIIIVTDKGSFAKGVETGDKFPEHCYVKKMGLPAAEYSDYRCYKSQTEKHSLVKLQEPAGEVKACHNDFCCFLKYSANDMKEDFYLTAFSGLNDVRSYFHWKEETCLLLRCDPFENKPCTLQTSTSKTVFKNVELKASFNSQTIYATVSKNKFRLAPTKEWSYTKNLDMCTLNFQTDSDEPLLKVGLFGRQYDSDPPFVPYIKF